jgi:drug/metabolite transporter (DMT)-like permease
VVNRGWAARRSAIDVAFWQNTWAALVLVVIAVATGTAAPSSAREIGLLLVLGLVCTALAHTLFIAALQVASAHTASVISALEPVYGIVLALGLLGEVPAPRTWVGGALIVGAAVIATRRA